MPVRTQAASSSEHHRGTGRPARAPSNRFRNRLSLRADFTGYSVLNRVRGSTCQGLRSTFVRGAARSRGATCPSGRTRCPPVSAGDVARSCVSGTQLRSTSRVRVCPPPNALWTDAGRFGAGAAGVARPGSGHGMCGGGVGLVFTNAQSHMRWGTRRRFLNRHLWLAASAPCFSAPRIAACHFPQTTPDGLFALRGAG